MTESEERRRCREALPNATLVEVSGAIAPWLNQRYSLEDAKGLKLRLGSDRLAHKVVDGKGIYIGSCASPKGPDSLPYIWFDWKNRQWKIATIGFTNSHYLCSITSAGIFPEDACKWQPGPRSRSECEDPLFSDEARRCAKEIKISVIQRASSCSSCIPTHCESNKSLKTSNVIPDSSNILKSKLAQEFLRDGFVVIRESEVGTRSYAADALRAANICVRDAFETGAGVEKLRDHVVQDSDSSWLIYDNLLDEHSHLWLTLCQFTDFQLARPKRCQLAIIFPEGRPEDDYSCRKDGRSQLSYHIDGRGQIPNGFTLLVGIALNDQASSCSSWGGLTVFPGSHMHSELHKFYPAQKRGELGQWIDLGKGTQLSLRQGDVVIAHSLLAHRSSENWSELVRCMAYFRLQPSQRVRGWEDDLLTNPLANVKGVVKKANMGDELDEQCV